jgi:hypothetical protein
MSRSPDVIGAAYVITRAANIVRPIANFNCDGTRITAVVGPARIRSAIIRSVARIGAVISFASTCTEGGQDQNQH